MFHWLFSWIPQNSMEYILWLFDTIYAFIPLFSMEHTLFSWFSVENHSLCTFPLISLVCRLHTCEYMIITMFYMMHWLMYEDATLETHLDLSHLVLCCTVVFGWITIGQVVGNSTFSNVPQNESKEASRMGGLIL